MSRRVAVLVVLAILAGAAYLQWGVARPGGTSGSPHQPEVARPPAPAPAARPALPLAARLVRRAQLRASPGGRVVHTLGLRTEFGSAQVLAVVERKPGWLGVLSPHMPNSRAGWIPESSARLRSERYALDVDRSARRIVVRHLGQVVRRIRIAVGRPANPTPLGRFAITDMLELGGPGGPYGCCALALTARQPHIAQGWTGGDRIAIHGTSDETSIGTFASGGCMRASERDMRWLMARLTLGTPVRVQA